MRAVLTTFGSYQDVAPILALAAELRRAGHQPMLALSPNFADWARAEGIEFAPLGPAISPQIRESMAGLLQNKKPPEDARYFLETVLPLVPEIYQSLREICRNADVLIGSPYQPACLMVHEATSIPYVSLHLSQFDSSNNAMCQASASIINSYRVREGLPHVDDPFGADGHSNQLALYAISRHFFQSPAQCPDHYKAVGFFFHQEQDWQPEPGLEKFCSSGERPVVAALSNLSDSEQAAMADALMQAARQAPCRLIIQREAEAPNKVDAPESVYLTGFAPQAWLFSQAALLVHSGDAVTTASALRAGVPAVVVPPTLDPPVWIKLAQAKGCVKNVIPLPHLNSARLAAAIRSALAAPQLYQAAAAMGTDICAEAGVQTARGLIEELVATRQRAAQDFSQKSEKAKHGQPPLAAVPREEEMPLSYAQQRLWFADRLEPGNTSYNMPFFWRFEGKMQRSDLQHVLNEMVRRHEILRTIFPVRDGRPVQKIAPAMDLALEEIDLEGFPPEDREAEMKKIANREMTWRFDLSQGPLWRMTWLRLDENTHVLLGNLHHIVSDGWSQAIMLQEISQLYEAHVRNTDLALSPLRIHYADYAVWQREWLSGQVMDEQLAYWRGQLAGLPVLQLPTDFQRPAIMSHRGGSAKYQFSNELTERLKALARREGATLFMIMLGALQVLLSKYSGQEDVAVGTPIAGRTRKELEGVLGCFINMLTLRMDLSSNPDFRDVIRRARHAALEGYQHQDVPFEKVVQDLQTERDVSRTPLFQVMLVFQNMQMVQPRLEGLRFIEWVDLNESAPFDLTLEITESRGLHCRLSYVRDLYTMETASRLLHHLDRVLESMVAAPELRIADFSLLTPAELHQVLVEWNGVEFDCSHEQCIHEVFEQIVSRQPSAAAVEYEGQVLTYDELNRQANQMARHLRKLGVRPETPVAMCMERRLEMAIGMLGIFKAGGAYIPLDPGLPRERLKWMLNDINPPVIITQTEVAQKLPLTGQIVCVDDSGLRETLACEQDDNLGPTALSSNAVYIIYTSGSTGRPKAIVATHDGLINLAQFQQKTFGVTPQDRVLQMVAPSFDPAIGDCFTGWVGGAAVVLGPDPRHTLGRDLAQLIQDQRITYTGLTPSILDSMADVELSGLKVLLTGGASCSRELVCRWGKGRRLFNVYGPTETTICATLTQLSEIDGSDPIGKPLGNVQVYVLDRHMNPVPAGMRGELYVGGIGVSRGYWKRPDLTAERFVPNVFSKTGGERLYRTGDIVRWRMDQKLEFVGRADEQIKIREQRIELGEIEAALRQREDVREAIVIAREDQPGVKRLVAYVVPEQPGRENDLPNELRAALREELPAYMVPSHFVIMSAFPINVSGKIDRRGFPVPLEPKATSGLIATDALTEIERKIASVWSEVLSVEKVGVHDNFFDLGGDSFQSIRVQSELVKALGREIKVLELFRFPTVRALAEYLAQQTSGDGQQTPESTLASEQLLSASLDAGKERLKRQLAQREALKSQRASAATLTS